MLKLHRLIASAGASAALLLAMVPVEAAPAETTEAAVCAQPPEGSFYCPAFGCECDTRTICGPEVFNGMVDFVRQKDNGKCVYRCHTTQKCTTRTCCPNREPACEVDSFTIDGAFRVRIGPFAPGACPAADPGLCDGSIPVEPDDGF